MGRGGRILLDRASSNYDHVWSRLDYTIFETQTTDLDSRLPGIIETKLLDSAAERVLSVDDSSEKVFLQNPPIQNNHHNNNIVIKSENSKNQETSDDQTEKLTHGEKSRSLNNQKLDDFEQLLDSASASSNIINKKLVCKNNSDISAESFMLKSSGSSSLSQNELFNKNISVGLLNSFNCEASSSGVSSTNGSLSFNLTNMLTQTNTGESGVHELTKQTTENDDEEDDLEHTTYPSHEDFYTNLMDEIKSEWLHFRPKTPPIRSSPIDDLLFDSDLIDKTKKFAVELQMLDDGYKETEMNSYIDNIYISQPMSFNFTNKHILLNDDSMQENIINVKTEPTDKDYDFTEEPSTNGDELSAKPLVEQDAVKKLLEKYQNDVAQDGSLEIDMDAIDFDECFSNNEPLGCSSFKLLNEDFTKKFTQGNADAMFNNKIGDAYEATIKNENPDYPVELSMNSLQSVAIAKEAPIAELQSHNYVLQYGSPVTSNTVTLNPNSTNMLSCNPSVDSVMSPATTLFQQQFINSGNSMISAQQSQQNKLQPIVYDSNTIVLAAAPTRKQLNGPTDRNCNGLNNLRSSIF